MEVKFHLLSQGLSGGLGEEIWTKNFTRTVERRHDRVFLVGLNAKSIHISHDLERAE